MFNFSKTITIKDVEGRVLTEVAKDATEVRIPYQGCTVDFRPLNGHRYIEHIELTVDESYEFGYYAGEAILPKKLPALRFLEVGWEVENPAVLTNFKELRHLNAGVSCWPKNLEFIRAFPNLESLEIGAMYIDNLEPLTDFPMLRGLVLHNGYKFDLKPLARCTKLEKLKLFEHVKGAKVLKELSEMKELGLENFKLKNLNYIKHMAKLKYLSLRGSKMTDFDGIQNFTNLEKLELRQSKIDNHNLTHLSGLTKLRELSLKFVNTVTDISPLENVPALEELNMHGMKGPIKSLAPLRKLTKLKSLITLGTEILENPVSVLCEMTSLEKLEVTLQTIDDQNKVKAALGGCEIYFSLLADPSTYKDIGFVRVCLPEDKDDGYFISQDITEELSVDDQDQAEDKVKEKLVEKCPHFIKHLEFDSEGSAFVVRCDTMEPIVAVAELINQMASVESPDFDESE